MPRDSATAFTLVVSTRCPNQDAIVVGEAQCVRMSDISRKKEKVWPCCKSLPAVLEAMHRYSGRQVLFLTSEIDRPAMSRSPHGPRCASIMKLHFATSHGSVRHT
jgi:hypothetical protein